MGAAKVRISLPSDLLALVDRAVQNGGGSRSEFIARVLRDRSEQAERDLMIEGYQAMAEENRRLSEEHLHAAGEVVSHAEPTR